MFLKLLLSQPGRETFLIFVHVNVHELNCHVQHVKNYVLQLQTTTYTKDLKKIGFL